MPKAPVVDSHWSQLIEGLQASALEFYERVEAAIERRELPNAKRERVDWREGGLLSAKREYLRVKRKKLVFDICAAPYGSGFFVSWWHGEFQSLFDRLRQMPWLGDFLTALRPMTYYKADTTIMFRTSVHQAVLDVVDEYTKAKGLRLLSEGERKPILKDFFR